MAVWRVPSRVDPKLPLMEQLRLARGLEGEPAVRPDPVSVPGMEEAAAAVLRALRGGRKVAVFGDYDCDGVCGAAVLASALRRLGAEPLVRLPERSEGYGMKPAHAAELAARGVELVITVDNGTAAREAVSAARSLGLEVVVTDHHEPHAGLPACPVANPKLPGSSFAGYSGAGVAYLLACELSRASGLPDPEDLLDLVALATVADVCPITGPNRWLAREGLLRMRRDPRPGVKALAAVSAARRVNGYALGWYLGPRVNAAGRLDSPWRAYELLTAPGDAEAAGAAAVLDSLNARRQAITKSVASECMKSYDGSYFPVFVADCPPGVVGLVAGRLAEALRRPVVVGTREGGVVRASGRTVGGFDLLGAIEECRRRTGLPEEFGGHRQAAGLSFDARDFFRLKHALDSVARERLKPEDIAEWVDVDGVLMGPPPLEEVRELDSLEPCGAENPEPVFAVSGPAEVVRSGDGWQVLSVNGVEFFVPADVSVPRGKVVHAAVTPYADVFRDVERVAFKLVDIRAVSLSRESLAAAYAAWRRGEAVGSLEEKVFAELGLARSGSNRKVSLLESAAFRQFGVMPR